MHLCCICKHVTHRCMCTARAKKPHYMVGLNKHFVGENIKASIFISGWKIADITSKEERILDQFFRLNLFALGLFNGNLIFDYMTLFQSLHIFSDFYHFELSARESLSVYSKQHLRALTKTDLLYSPSLSHSTQSLGFVTNRLLNHLKFSDVRCAACSSGCSYLKQRQNNKAVS